MILKLFRQIRQNRRDRARFHRLLDNLRIVGSSEPDLWSYMTGRTMADGVRSVYRFYGAPEPIKDAPLFESLEGAIALVMEAKEKRVRG